MPVITALYAGILGLISIVLAFQAGSMRGKTKISIGDGGNSDMLLAMRRHGNFVEYVPLALVLIMLLEMNAAPSLAIHIMGAGLVLARIAHPIGLQADSMNSIWRAVGAGGSTVLILVASLWAIAIFF